MVPKAGVASPQHPIKFDEVDVIRQRLPAPKELSSGHALLAAVHVASWAKGGDAGRNRTVGRATSQDIEDRLGAHARHGSAAYVLEPKREVAARLSQALCFGGE
jgi:hypothetical protein